MHLSREHGPEIVAAAAWCLSLTAWSGLLTESVTANRVASDAADDWPRRAPEVAG